MKILYDCFSCSPYYGSDEGIGWLWPYHMSQYHEVWVLVRKDRREDIQKYGKEHKMKNIHFIYADIPDWMNFYYRNKKKKKNGTLDFLAYQFLWQFVAIRTARKWHKKIHFDLVHHASTNDFRLIGRMDRLGIPLIIGPIGGAQETPESVRYYVRYYEKNEKLRSILNELMTHFPGYKKALNSADRVFFSNKETLEYVSPLIKNQSKCGILTEVGCSTGIDISIEDAPSKEKDDLSASQEDAKTNSVLKMMWAGRMEYRKGLELLFDALELLPEDLAWELTLCGEGSRMNEYMAIVAQKKYRDKVIFTGKLPMEELNQIYEQANLFVFPSLRETTGTVIIEAMAHGIPVIALEQGGAVEVITESTGFLIPVNGSKNEVLARLSGVIRSCIENPDMVSVYGKEAQKRIIEKYTWQNKVLYMKDVYEKLANGR